MKKRFNILTAISVCLLFSTLPGCGCGSISTTEPIETMESTIETESVSQEETSQVPETIEEESVIESEPVETEETMEPTESVSEKIAITEMNETMYAITNVNIRSEASADSDKLGALSTGESILVTGVTADELWYRVEEGETIGFVSSEYLSLDKPVIESVVSTPQQSEAVTQTETPLTGSAEAPNPGAQAVYDQMNQNAGQTTDPNTPAPGATPDNINGDMFGTPIDGTSLFDGGGTGVLHAAE